MMTRKTTKMRMLIAARPSYINPVLLAKMIATFDQLSGGRISVNLIAGQSEAENIAEGVRWSKEQRYEIMDEEVSILKALWTQTGPTDLERQVLHAREGRADAQALPEAVPEVLSGRRLRTGGGALGQALRRAPVLGRHDRADRRQHEDAAGPGGQARPRERARLRHAPADRVPREREGCLGRGRRARAQRHGRAHQLHPDLLRPIGRQSARAGAGADQGRSDRAEPLERPDARRAPAPASASSATPSSAPTCCSSYIDIGCHSFCLSGYLHDAEAERFHRLVRPILADRNRGRMQPA